MQTTERNSVSLQTHFRLQAKASKRPTDQRRQLKSCSPQSAPRPTVSLHAAKRGKQAHRREIEARSPAQRAKMERSSVSRIQANSVVGGITADGLGRGNEINGPRSLIPNKSASIYMRQALTDFLLWRLALGAWRFPVKVRIMLHWWHVEV